LGQPHVRDELEHELEVALDAVLAGLPLAGALVRGGGEGGIAAAAASALPDEDGLTRSERLTQQLPGVGVAHLGPGRHGQGEVGARLPRHVLSLAVLAALRLPLGAVAVVEQRAEVGVGAHIHAAAFPPRPAIGAALGDELFAAEAGRTRASGPPHDMHDGSVNEHPDRQPMSAECGMRSAEYAPSALS